jgi:hypothetical protein
MPLRQASVSGQPAQPAVPADRCAREIVGILKDTAGELVLSGFVLAPVQVPQTPIVVCAHGAFRPATRQPA